MSDVKEIIYSEMDNLLKKMNDDFKENYEKKINNWVLNRFDNKIRAQMVFVSSFESKYGNMFENISQEIAKIKFGEDNVKLTFKGIGVTDEEYEEYSKKIKKEAKKSKSSKKTQYVISKLCEDNTIFTKFRDENKGDGRKRIESTLNQSKFPELLTKINSCDKIIEQPVDLLYYNSIENKYNIFEIKAGGNLDSSNAPQNIVKMLKIYSSLGKSNANLYFATLYNKNGEGNTWSGSVKYKIAPDVLLIGEKFWNKILPDDISFYQFKEYYYEVFEELDFQKNLNDLIEITLNE